MEVNDPAYSEGAMVPVNVVDFHGLPCFDDYGNPIMELVPAEELRGNRGMSTRVPLQEKRERLAEVLHKLAILTCDGKTEQAVVHMQEVEKWVKQERPEPDNLFVLLKQQAVHTHIMALLDNGRPLSEYRAQLLGRFGALLLTAAGEDRTALDDGLRCVQTALASGLLAQEDKKMFHATKKELCKRLGIPGHKKKKKKKKISVAKSEIGENAELDAHAQERSTPKFLSFDTPGGARCFKGEEEIAKGSGVGKKKEKKKKKKTKKKKKKKKESPIDMAQFERPWDQVVMRLLGQRYKSCEQAREYLTCFDTNFEIPDPSLKKALHDQLCYTVFVPDALPQEMDEDSNALSVDRQQQCYIVGRLLLDNAEVDCDQEKKHIAFKLVQVAAKADYTLAQLYLARSDKTGLSKRKRIFYLTRAAKHGLKGGVRKRAIEIARQYTEEGYLLPLFLHMAWEMESGKLDAYLQKLEQKFPPLHIYDIDEQFIANLDLQKVPPDRWSAQVLRSVANVIYYLKQIEDDQERDEKLLQNITNEVENIEKRSVEHPELKSLVYSCYSLLGRAYTSVGDITRALAAYGSAMIDGDQHETILINYIRLVLHPCNKVSMNKKYLSSIENKIKKLVKHAENYKASAFLLYASFHSRCNNKDEANWFMKMAGKQMKQEHSQEDARTMAFYNAMVQEIKMTGVKKKKGAEKQEQTAPLAEVVRDTLNSARQAIIRAEQNVQEDPLAAVREFHQHAQAGNFFGMLNIDHDLKTHYNTVIKTVGAKMAHSNEQRWSDEYTTKLKAMLKELRKWQQLADMMCIRDADDTGDLHIVCLPR